MADLIERKPLYERAARLEAEALDYASKLIERGSNGEATSEEWRIWSAVLAERTAFKHDVFDAPSAKPKIVRCKDCEHYWASAELCTKWTRHCGGMGYCDEAERKENG